MKLYGVSITEGPSDWEILQQKNGYAKIVIKGTYQVPQGLKEEEVLYTCPMLRVVKEEDNTLVFPWEKPNAIEKKNGVSGSFQASLKVPAGGMYRIDTALETRFLMENGEEASCLYRGDCILHLGVGNVFIIAGQSNSAGGGSDYCIDSPDMSVHLYRNRSRWDIASHPMNECTEAGELANAEAGIPGVSPYLSFGKCYAKLTGMPVGLIQTALGGSVMKQWEAKVGPLYQNMMEKIRQTKGQYAGILWYQGCSDTHPDSPKEPLKFTAAEHYLEHFRELVEAVREELGYEIPFFTMQINRRLKPSNDEAWGKVREAQRIASKTIPKVYILPTINLNLSDFIHNNAASNVVLGERIAKQCAYVLNGKEEFCAPELVGASILSKEQKEKCRLEGSWLALTFTHVKHGFRLFSASGEESGFLLEDEAGKINIEEMRVNPEEKKKVYLKIERCPIGDTYLSFAWEANPVRFPLADDVTFLPPLSFYKNKLEGLGR